MPDLFGNADPHLALAAKRFALVAVEQGVDTAGAGLTYGVPDHLADLRIGERVVVPLGRGNKKTTGYVVELAGESDIPAGKVKWVEGRDPSRLSLAEDLVDLARWMAAYYVCPLGMVFAAMLPSAVKKGTGLTTRLMVRLPDAARGSAEPSEVPGSVDPAKPQAAAKAKKLTKLQKAVLGHARRHAETGEPWIEVRELADEAGAKSVAPVKSLVESGLLEAQRAETMSGTLDARAAEVAEPVKELTLNEGQRAALEHVVAQADRGFSVHLLHGVTGSGKTEVYLRAIDHVVAAGGSAIVLVPEIALTPQTVARFFGRFDPSTVAVLHSGLTASQRHAQWRRIRAGESRVVVGARSAVFAPLPNLGLIVVDEEHESTYKQDQLPRYHARDVAIKRAQLLGVPIVLGSATPSLESYANAAQKRYDLLRLPERAPGMRLPHVEIVDLVLERRNRRGVHLLSQRLEEEIRKALAPPGAGASVPVQGGKIMLLLNRRGYANYIACPDHRCGWMKGCDFCDATMVYHRDASLPAASGGGLVRCHKCEAEQILPQLCPVCSRKVTVFGLGVQRVEEELHAKFPGVRALRMDSDTMRTGGDYRASLDAFRRGDADVLLGTQMIAKGLDFPTVRLVGVISGDTALHMPDFRASERTFQLIAQVAGRAGRSGQRGKVIVQTFSPEDPAIQLASAHDYDTFAANELEQRRLAGLPPVARMARIVVRDKDLIACTARARELYDHLLAFSARLFPGSNAIRIRPPAPCPIARIADYHRHQIELIAAPAAAGTSAGGAANLQRLLAALRQTRLLISDLHTAVDVDPVALL